MEKVRIQDDLYTYVNQAKLEELVIPDDMPVAGGFAALRTDVEKLMIGEFNAMCKDGVILKQDTVAMMTTNQLNEKQAADFNLPGYIYGLGVRCPKDAESELQDAGWDGAAGCYFSASPEDKLAVFMARNIRPAANAILPVLVMNSIYGENF